MTWIRVIEPSESEGFLRRVYEEVEAARGKVANVWKVFSLNPHAMKSHLDLYLSIMYPRRRGPRLGRAEREMIAVVVSSLNRCGYCVAHHIEALKARWGGDVDSLARDYRSAGLDSAHLAMLEFADKLTREPWSMSEEDVEGLRVQGFTDEEILDIVLIVSYFNFVNRVVSALGVKYDEEETRGYRY